MSKEKHVYRYQGMIFPLIYAGTQTLCVNKFFEKFAGGISLPGYKIAKTITMLLSPFSSIFIWFFISFVVYTLITLFSKTSKNIRFLAILMDMGFVFVLYIIFDIIRFYQLNNLTVPSDISVDEFVKFVNINTFVRERAIISSVITSLWAAFISYKKQIGNIGLFSIFFIILGCLLILNKISGLL